MTFDSLCVPQCKAIKISFHVIVPKCVWEWDDSSSIHIQFGHKNLGYWQNCGEFYESRYGYDCYLRTLATSNEFITITIPAKSVIHETM